MKILKTNLPFHKEEHLHYEYEISVIQHTFCGFQELFPILLGIVIYLTNSSLLYIYHILSMFELVLSSSGTTYRSISYIIILIDIENIIYSNSSDMEVLCFNRQNQRTDF